jgi:rare lipoprotein A
MFLNQISVHTAIKTLILISSSVFLLIEITACSSTSQVHSTHNTTVAVPIISPTPAARKKLTPAVPKATQLPDSSGYIAEGKGSWYGISHHGAKMANGQLYDLYGMTAAHATLPLLSRVQVTNKLNSRKVVVTITDRLPERENQHFLIKLSYWAARSIGLDKAFSAPVEVRGLASKYSKFKTATTVSRRQNEIYLKIGSFNNPNDAYKLRNQLSSPFSSRVFVQQKANQYQVRLGPFANWNESDRAIRILQKYGIRKVLVVPKTDN